jgi:FMN reductase
MLVVAIDGSPVGGGKTATVLQQALAGAAERGAKTKLVSLADGVDPDVLDGADALIVGSPVYRASYTGLLKTFLDATPRGMWGETKAPLQARAAGIVLTGADDHHFLAIDQLRSVLAGFFAMHVVAPGLYVARTAFGDDGSLTDTGIIEQALNLGRGVVDLAQAIAASDALSAARPQA